MEAQADYGADWRQAEEIQERRQFVDELMKRFETGLYDDNDLRALRRELTGEERC